MKSPLIFLAALLTVPATLFAQDGTKPSTTEMPNPKRKEHDALSQLVGDWQFEMKLEAMPGVPGMEAPSESKGTEHAELICSGLWLKSVINATYQGAPFQGVWLAGFDPFKKQYASIWISSDEQECGVSTMDGTYDPATKTWTWNGLTPHGEMRSTLSFKDADHNVEICFMKTPDGKEAKCMEITRTRSKAPVAIEANASSPPKLSKDHELLQSDIGDWEATVKTTAAGKPATEDKASERVVAICNSRWLWSDFNGRFQDQPFEGHSLIGYDPAEKKYVSLWIDSMSATAARTTGIFDAARKEYVLEGTSLDPTGKPTTIKEVMTRKDGNTRLLRMECQCAGQGSQMEITYKRKA